MSIELAPTELPDGLGFLTEVDTTQTLTALTDQLNAVCEEVEDRADKSVVVLRLAAAPVGSRAWPGEASIQQVSRWDRAVRRLERLAAVSIAVAQGACAGASLDLMLAADFRIAAPDLRLVLPVNDGHLWPGMGVHRLVQHLGVARARQIVMWGVDVSAEQAIEFGLVDQVSENLTEAVHTAVVLSGRISDRELALRRQLLLEAAAVEYDDALGVHLAACDRELRRLREVSAAAVPTGRPE